MLITPPQNVSLLREATRIHRTRCKGWRLPEEAIYVGRPTMWGNPFTIGRWGHAKCVILHQRWLNGQLGALSLERMGFCPAEVEALYRLRERVLANMHRLAGHDLACWCPLSSRWCHAETLLDLVPRYAEIEKVAA